MSLTEAELLEAVERRFGLQVSPRQLRRMREHGLLRTPQHDHPPGTTGGSTSSVPESTVAQVAKIVEFRRQDRNDERALIRLWWLRYPVNQNALRELMLTPLEHASDEFTQGLALHRGDVIETAKFFADSLLTTVKSDPTWKLQRRRLTARADELRDAAVAVFMQLLGEDPGLEIADEGKRTPGEVLEQLTGIERARNDPLTPIGGWLSDSVTLEDVFADLARWLNGQRPFEALIERLNQASDEQLDWSRDDIQWLGEAFQGLVDEAESRLGFDAGGFGELTSIFRPQEAHQLALATVMGLELQSMLLRPLVPPDRATKALIDLVLGASARPQSRSRQAAQ